MLLSPDLSEARAKASQVNRNINFITQPISFNEFFLEYLYPNKPCIFGSWATDSWLCRKKWVTEDSRINFEYLKDEFGDCDVPVADCNQVEYEAHTKKEMKARDYFNSMQNDTTECRYLKDWHFTRDCPDYKAYSVPEYFKSDWLNEFWDCKFCGEDDYRFVYIGPKDSWTNFHVDVFKSYSWSANIHGCKKWIIYPPGEEIYLTDENGHLIFDVTSDQIENRKRYPDAKKAERKLICIQNSGEIIFIPSGWHHQVHNLEDTISINHNWFNGCCLDMVWNNLQHRHELVMKEISDCKEMPSWLQQCQIILKADSGMDYSDFFEMITLIAQRRLSLCINKSFDGKPCSNTPSLMSYESSDRSEKCDLECVCFSRDITEMFAYYSDITCQHAHLELNQIKDMLHMIDKDEYFRICLESSDISKPQFWIEKIEQFLKYHDSCR